MYNQYQHTRSEQKQTLHSRLATKENRLHDKINIFGNVPTNFKTNMRSTCKRTHKTKMCRSNNMQITSELQINKRKTYVYSESLENFGPLQVLKGAANFRPINIDQALNREFVCGKQAKRTDLLPCAGLWIQYNLSWI